MSASLAPSKTNRTNARTPWERFPYAVLPVSTIAEQCYCEHRVHLWLDAPGNMVSVPRSLERTQGPPMRQIDAASAGTDFHERASQDVTRVSASEIRKIVKSNPTVQLLESPLESEFGSLPIAGVPDGVCFEEGEVRCILEYKLTDSNQLQMSHRVQLQLYGWLLQKSKFQHEDSLCVCVLIPTQNSPYLDELDSLARQSLATTIHRIAREYVEDNPKRINWYINRVMLGAEFWVRLRIFRYSALAARRELKFFAPYWNGERKAIPSTNFRKCRVCQYNAIGKCKVAAGEYDGGL
jgi:hypothetical protein